MHGRMMRYQVQECEMVWEKKCAELCYIVLGTLLILLWNISRNVLYGYLCFIHGNYVISRKLR